MPLPHLSVLVVEDQALLAFDVADLLEASHPVRAVVRHSLAQGLQACSEPVDLAILDIDLGDGKSFPIADHLARRGVPFAFMSGSRPQDLPERFRSADFIAKPFDRRALSAWVGARLGPAARPAGAPHDELHA